MGALPIKPSLTVARLLRQKRKERKWTLRQVSEELGRRGQRIPSSTLARIETGHLDPGVRRLFLLLDLYGVPPHLVSDLIELENLASETPPPEEDLEALFRRGLEYWKSGDIGHGLAYLFAVRLHVPVTPEARILRQKATLSFATAARNLGKFRVARQVVDDLLCEPPDETLRAPVLVLASSLWRGLGSKEVALALVREAERHVATGDKSTTAWVRHQKAKLLVETGQLTEGERELNAALQKYRQTKDTYGELRARLLEVVLLDRRRKPDRALARAREVVEFSKLHGHDRGIVYGLLELGRLLVRAGSAAEGIDELTGALSRAVFLRDRNAEFLAHFHLWKAHDSAGDRERADFERTAAEYFVQYVDDHSPESDETRARMRGKKGGGP